MLHSTSSFDTDDDNSKQQQSQQQNNQSPSSQQSEEGEESIEVDPYRDIDIAPFLDCCCGYLPCCCCLYSYIPAATSAEEEDEYIDYDGGCFSSNRDVVQVDAPVDNVGDNGGGGEQARIGMLKVRNAFPVNKNVLLTLFISLLHGIADSLWNGTVLYAFLYIVYGGRNDWIGFMEALLGLSAVLFSFFPVGYLTNKWSKSGTIQLGACIFLLGASLNTWLVLWIGTDEQSASPYGYIYNAEKAQTIFNYYLPLMLSWGFVSSIINGPTLELYTSSIQAQDHPSYFFVYFATYRIASTIGPLVSIVIFQCFGNRWDVKSLQVNIIVGMAMEFVVGVFCFGFRESWALEVVEEEEEEGNESRVGQIVQGTTNEDGLEVEGNDLSTPLLSNNDEPTQQKHQMETEHEEEDAQSNQQQPPPPPEIEITTCNILCFTLSSTTIPYILFISSFITAAGGGMTIKFFPLYFKNDVNFLPSSIQGMYVLIPFTQVVLTEIMTSLSSCFGRVQTILLAKCLGILFIILIANGENWLQNKSWILAPLFIFRSVLMNSTLPLEQSILMDFANDEQCKRWKWLDQFVSAMWAGSAAIGGVLIDQHDYSYTFKITAYLQGGGVFFLLFLLPFVPRQKNAPPIMHDAELEVNEEDASRTSPLSHEEEEAAADVRFI